MSKKQKGKNIKKFADRVRDVVRKIPVGKTLTYKKVAELAGSPKAFRAVGNVLRQNYDKSVPCHRVVRSDGGIGGYNRGGVKMKKKILEREFKSLR